MNRDDVTRMAREVGLPHWYETEGVVNEELLIKFAALVTSAERNRCVARADIALLGADITLRDRVLKAINIRGQT